jgi:hypothetical protein
MTGGTTWSRSSLPVMNSTEHKQGGYGRGQVPLIRSSRLFNLSTATPLAIQSSTVGSPRAQRRERSGELPSQAAMAAVIGPATHRRLFLGELFRVCARSGACWPKHRQAWGSHGVAPIAHRRSFAVEPHNRVDTIPCAVILGKDLLN